MSDRRIAFVAASALAGVGLVLIAARARSQTQPDLRPGERVWRLTYDIRMTAPPAGSRLRVRIPSDGNGCRVFRQTFSYPGLAMDLVTGRRTRAREAVVVSLAKQAPARFHAEFDVRVGPRTQEPAKKPNAGERSRYLRSEEHIQTQSPMVKEVLVNVVPKGASLRQALEHIAVFCYERIEADPAGAADAERSLRAQRASHLGRSRAMVALCRARRIPARLVVGFRLQEEGVVRPAVWVEAHVGKRWLASDPEHGHVNNVPDHYLPARRGGTRIVLAPTAVRTEREYGLQRLDAPSATAGSREGNALRIVDLQRLTPGMKTTLAILLLLPLGALITAFFRNVVGIPTFGTFTPCLLGLSFVNADWRTGVVVCGTVVLIGILGRRLLDGLRLLMVSRLSVVLTLIVVCMVFAISALDYYGLTPSARAALLPMVILTMLVERFHITTEEDGFHQALQVLLGTLAIAACCLAILVWQGLRDLALRFPEGQLCVAALLILIGRYTGYRVSELWRFRSLADPSSLGDAP